VIRGSCHCGAVRFEFGDQPQWLTRFNCSFCRRAGVLWAYAERNRIALNFEANATSRYIWGDKTLAFHICKICGCTTHWESLEPDKNPRMAVNCALAEPGDIAGLRVRNFDGADSWSYLD